jgi:hypothetical protein
MVICKQLDPRTYIYLSLYTCINFRENNKIGLLLLYVDKCDCFKHEKCIEKIGAFLVTPFT